MNADLPPKGIDKTTDVLLADWMARVICAVEPGDLVRKSRRAFRCRFDDSGFQHEDTG